MSRSHGYKKGQGRAVTPEVCCYCWLRGAARRYECLHFPVSTIQLWIRYRYRTERGKEKTAAEAAGQRCG